MIGTPAYMSPEQAWGNVANMDHRSDIYSWGLSYMNLTNQLFLTGSVQDIIAFKRSGKTSVV